MEQNTTNADTPKIIKSKYFFRNDTGLLVMERCWLFSSVVEIEPIAPDSPVLVNTFFIFHIQRNIICIKKTPIWIFLCVTWWDVCWKHCWVRYWMHCWRICRICNGFDVRSMHICIKYSKYKLTQCRIVGWIFGGICSWINWWIRCRIIGWIVGWFVCWVIGWIRSYINKENKTDTKKRVFLFFNVIETWIIWRHWSWVFGWI